MVQRSKKTKQNKKLRLAPAVVNPPARTQLYRAMRGGIGTHKPKATLSSNLAERAAGHQSRRLVGGPKSPD